VKPPLTLLKMEAPMRIEIFSLVDDVMRHSPGTIRVFLDFRMNCVGCPIASFHSIEDACREHSVDIATFVAALRAVPA
jgi:hybrid cluster-associated redox disulfide protein